MAKQIIIKDYFNILRDEYNRIYCIQNIGDPKSLIKAIREQNEYIQAKEQEFELLKEDEKSLLNVIDHLQKTKNEWEEKYNDLGQDFDQLKAENDKYSIFIEKLCDYIGLEYDSEEQAMRTLSDFARQMNKAIWIIDRYKQTLLEIKEIAENVQSFVGRINIEDDVFE